MDAFSLRYYYFIVYLRQWATKFVAMILDKKIQSKLLKS